MQEINGFPSIAPIGAHLRCGRHVLKLSRPLIMGIVNVTPDSFSDGGHFSDPIAALAHARQLVEEGADILDIGGESTRPGAKPVPLSEELQRVLPVLRGLEDAGVPVSIDTYKPDVMRAALDAGASMINDVNALRAEGAFDAVRASDCAVCLMHMRGTPQTMQDDPHYDDVVAEVRDFLTERVNACTDAGVALERIVVDPGFGFGKRSAHNLALLRRLAELSVRGAPVLAGLSRKGTLGKITKQPVADRTVASVAAALLAVQRGAAIVRVHDVAQTRDALAILGAVNQPGFRFDD